MFFAEQYSAGLVGDTFHDELLIEEHLNSLARFQRRMPQLERRLERIFCLFLGNVRKLNIKFAELTPIGVPEFSLILPLFHNSFSEQQSKQE